MREDVYLMVGGPVDGERWETDGRDRIFVPERIELPSAIFDAEARPGPVDIKQFEYIARRLRSPDKGWLVYQDATMEEDIIEALILGYRVNK